MFKRSRLGSAVLAALASPLVATPAHAQVQLERVEITGSSVRRIDAESALPVQILRRVDIERSGATSVVDLLQRLPATQGATAETSGVGGGTFGFAGVSLHNIGETRTLVLLNGRRLVQFGGQSLTGSGAAVDLNSIPISSIERIEILTDGASALYGSDAIAGVVNFITKRDTTEGDVTIGFSAPKGGALEKRISASKGFGSLDADNYNLFIAFGADRRNQLDASDRSYARTGVINFSDNGKQYQAFLGSPRGIPANVLDDAGNLVSPYFLKNGVCPPGNNRVFDAPSGTTSCHFDFVGALEIFPTRDRESFTGSYATRFGAHTLTLDLLLSKTESITRIAPVPGGVNILAGSALHNQYLLPLGITQDTTAFYRASDLGKRENTDTAEFKHVAVSLQGQFAGWDYNAAVGRSESLVKNVISGYPGALAFNRVLAAGNLDPFVGPGQQTAEALADLGSIAFRGYFDGGKSTLDTFDLRGSRELMTLPAGPLQLGTGISYYKERFASKPSAFAQGLLADPITGTACDPANGIDCEVRFGDESISIPYGADRHVYGLFAELVAPIVKGLEVSAAARYDKYSDVGNATTGKLSFRWTPSAGFLLRGSVGTGFKSPTVPQLNASRQQFGVTSAPYDCTPELQQVALTAGGICRPNGTQYDVVAQGNSALKPEKSRQASLGLRLEPAPTLSLGADLWFVGIRDAFGQITEDEVFGHPLRYPDAWTKQFEVSTGNTYLAWNAGNLNLGKEYYSCIDFDLTGRWTTRYGDVSSQLAATYMLREARQLLVGGPYYSSIGNNAELGTVAFRWRGKFINTLRRGDWSHTLGINFQSGYRDATYNAELLDAAGNPTGTFEDVRLKIKSTYTIDWQTQWSLRKNMSLTVGLLNVLDQQPPLSLAEGGLLKGKMFGYDDRYYDARGRTGYASFTLKF
ncbi:MAG: TonB-dependent receptor [Burkholderiaceae bacterium]